MSMTTIVHGKAQIEPILLEERNPFDMMYAKAKQVMDQTRYVWVNRRQIGFQWNFEKRLYELLIINPETEEVIERFIPTKEAIRGWASKAADTLARPVWTVVAHKTPEQEMATAMEVLTDQYAILSYTDIVSAIEQVCREISGLRTTEVIDSRIHPDYLTANIIMADLGIPMPTARMDLITVGVQISSGLTGKAAVYIKPWAKRTKCDNSLMFGDDTLAKFEQDRTVRIVHKWGGMQYDPADKQGDRFVLHQNNIDYLSGHAQETLLEEQSNRIGWKYRNKLRQAVQSNFEDAVKIVQGAAVAANTPIAQTLGQGILGNIIDQWLGEAPSDGVDLRKKDLKAFEYFQDGGSRANYLTRISKQLQFYGSKLGYSMYSVVQALTEDKILRDLPPNVRIVVEDWAARYCFGLSDQYNPNTTPVERIPPEEVAEILKNLPY